MPLTGTFAMCTVQYGTTERFNQLNVLWYRPGTPIDPASGQTAADHLATAMDTNIAPTLKGILCPDAQYKGCVVEINIGGVVFTAASTASAGAGGNDGVTSPELVAVVIRKRTSHGGKTGRGRWFIGCVPEDYTTIGVLGSTAIAAYQSLASAYNGDQVTAEATWGQYLHSKKDSALYKVDHTYVEAPIASQRRRRLRQTI